MGYGYDIDKWAMIGAFVGRTQGAYSYIVGAAALLFCVHGLLEMMHTLPMGYDILTHVVGCNSILESPSPQHSSKVHLVWRRIREADPWVTLLDW